MRQTVVSPPDAYVAAMKGTILMINPEARLVDISHEITPHDVMEAAFVLSQAVPYFPEETVHLVVVAPVWAPSAGWWRCATVTTTSSALTTGSYCQAPVMSPDRQLNETIVESCHFLFAQMPTERTQVVVELLDGVTA